MTCLRTWFYSNMPPGQLKIKKKSYLTDAPPPDMPTNTVKLYQPRQYTCRVESCYVAAAATLYACWPSVTVTNTTAVQTCLLIECCCKMDACRTVATKLACLLTFCQSILHVCWCCASLSSIPAGMVSHYQPCLLVSHYQPCLLVSHYQLCFIIGHEFWFGTSLSAMPVGVVAHCMSCLLVWYLTIGHAYWSVLHFN